ncbi:MAG: phosphopentomutase [Oscillospiraceae bacterium]|nr:phosphopentomutase [Oscillospiraceae bacterium]
MGMKRIFIIILDSFGIGALPDAKAFGDAGANTLASCAASGELSIPNMIAAGLGRIEGVSCLPKENMPVGAWGRMAEKSMGKDTTIGHWELAGLISDSPLPTYPDGFPEEILAPFRQQTGRGVLANAPWSGTEVIEAFGKQHMETGDLIVYTSADSVFQIAAHEDIVPPEQLYEYCRIARRLLKGKHGIGRVIARPFVGTPGNFKRTANRHDFSLEPPEDTLLDVLKEAGLSVIGVGKIHDIFAGQGLTEYVYNKSNANGMEHAMAYAGKDFRGLCFVNLVDFDSQFGHRRDRVGYAKALNEFDAWLPAFLELLGEEDMVLITADHGCDPGYAASTDHTREYVPLLVLGKGVQPVNLGTRESFADLAATVAELLGVEFATPGKSFAELLLKG